MAQKFDDAILSSGCVLNQYDKSIYSKFDAIDSGVIICLYVDDMLIFRTNQDQIHDTKKLLEFKFSMKGMEEAEVILVIRIKRMNKGIVMTQ